MTFRFLASLLGLLLTGGAVIAGAADTTPGARRPEFRRRPKAEFVVEGAAVFRLLPADAITAIDRPDMVPAASVSGLMGDEEPVLGVSDGKTARAWSTWMLDSHEVVNDRLGDIPIAATWCPLANTGVVYIRMLDDIETTFGVSGRLWRDSLVLFDRKTRTLWSQVSGRGLHGPRRDMELKEIPSVTTTWGAWKRLHPETLVLRPDDPSRSGSPFSDYFNDPARLGITKTIRPDPRLPGKDLVLGIRKDNTATAVPLERLAEDVVVQGQVGDTPLVLLSVASRGGLGYDRRLSSLTLDFEADQGRIRDRQTGSLWDPESGEALAGPLSGQKLRRVDSRSAYWYTWAAFHPSTEIVGGSPEGVQSEPPAD